MGRLRCFNWCAEPYVPSRRFTVPRPANASVPKKIKTWLRLLVPPQLPGRKPPVNYAADSLKIEMNRSFARAAAARLAASTDKLYVVYLESECCLTTQTLLENGVPAAQLIPVSRERNACAAIRKQYADVWPIEGLISDVLNYLAANKTRVGAIWLDYMCTVFGALKDGDNVPINDIRKSLRLLAASSPPGTAVPFVVTVSNNRGRNRTDFVHKLLAAQKLSHLMPTQKSPLPASDVVLDAVLRAFAAETMFCIARLTIEYYNSQHGSHMWHAVCELNYKKLKNN